MKKTTVLLLIPLTAVLCGLRLYQLLTLTEPETGFLLRFDWSAWTFYLLLAVGVIALMLASLLPLGRARSLPLSGAGSLGRGVAAGALGLAVAVESALDLLAQFNGLSESTLRGWRIAFDALGLCVAIYLIALCVSLCRKREPSIYPALALLPAAWLGCRALLRYLESRMVVTVPAAVLAVLTMVFLAVWWMAHAREQGNVDAARGQRMLDALTPVCLLLIVVSVLPAAIAAFAVGKEISPVSFADVTIAFMAPYLYLISRRADAE